MVYIPLNNRFLLITAFGHVQNHGVCISAERPLNVCERVPSMRAGRREAAVFKAGLAGELGQAKHSFRSIPVTCGLGRGERGRAFPIVPCPVRGMTFTYSVCLRKDLPQRPTAVILRLCSVFSLEGSLKHPRGHSRFSPRCHT